MKRKKTFRYLIIITVILIIIAFIGKRAGWFGENVVYKVSIEKPEERMIIETITANGKIQPETEVTISPDVSGEIVELHVKEGEEVKAGDLLLKIKPDIYQSSLERMEATLSSAKAQLSQAEAQFEDKENSFERNKKLWKEKAISDAEYETVEAAYLVAKANLESSKFSVKSTEASLKEAQENLIKTTIYAPMSGTISKLNVEKGERVVGTELMSGTEILRIADLDHMEVLVEVNENDIVRVGMGDTSVIEIDAYLDHKFNGIVTEIANSANTTGIATDQVTSFNVKVRILRESYLDLLPDSGKTGEKYYPFRPGMSATVDIQTHTVYDALSVPIQAVTTRADTAGQEFKDKELEEADLVDENEKDEEELKEVVFVYDQGKVFMREVKTGIQDNDHIEILEGLSIDEDIVVAPYSAVSKKLEDDMEVEIVEKEKLFEEE